MFASIKFLEQQQLILKSHNFGSGDFYLRKAIKFKLSGKLTIALNLAIIEMDYKFKFQPPENFEWAPLWNNVSEVYYPQGSLGK